MGLAERSAETFPGEQDLEQGACSSNAGGALWNTDSVVVPALLQKSWE